MINGKMVNGFRYYRALESVSIASALSTALTIYPCQIRVHQRWQSKLQLPTARKEWRPATADSSHIIYQYRSLPLSRRQRRIILLEMFLRCPAVVLTPRGSSVPPRRHASSPTYHVTRVADIHTYIHTYIKFITRCIVEYGSNQRRGLLLGGGV